MATALVVGASAGIGRALARRLVDAGWTVIGVARRPPPFVHERYRHVVADVRAPDYRDLVIAALDASRDEGGDRGIDACVYAAGIGEPIDIANLAADRDVFATNLDGAIATAALVLPRMVAARAGHFIGLSSQADRLVDGFAPSYNASKAALSSYLEGLALAYRPHGVAVTNVRFGFVDTAMSRHAKLRPFLITAERAAEVVERCLRRRPIRCTYPKRMAMTLWWFALPGRIRTWFS